jgi:hypothetical protein
LSTFFPENAPSPVTHEPPVWVRRLVLLRSVDAQPDIIREIQFELGLNLIVTRAPEPGTTEAVGHDVGKTLSTRLLRYLLGEAKYAEARTRNAIRRLMPDSFVAGEFRVRGENWAVMRPLGAPTVFVSRARAVGSWRDLLQGEGIEGEFEHFVSRLGDAVLENVSSPLLTHAHRPIQWSDVLAWIARDQKCRYGEPLDWRHTDSESGTRALYRTDACTVLRSITGLMNGREKELFEQHDAMLRERQVLDQEKKGLDTRIDAENVLLAADLSDASASDADISPIGLEVIRARNDGLRRLRSDEIEKLDLANLREQFERSVGNLTTVQAQIEAKTASVDALVVEIRKRKQRPLTIFEMFASHCDKPEDDCPAKLKIAQGKVPAPPYDDLREREATLVALQEQVTALSDSLPSLSEKREVAKSRLEAAEKALLTVTQGIDAALGTSSAIERRVDRQIQRIERRPKAVSELNQLDEKLAASLALQAQVRENLASTRAWLGERFAELCSTLLGTSRRFGLTIESKAIVLQQAGVDGAPGEATSTSALVLALDLAAMRCAMDGNGHHPRLIVLDSPREADMEIAIFYRLLAQLAAWHTASRLPPFQVIMTTTTRPSDGSEASKLVRTELSRVPQTETLLRTFF